MVRPETTPTLRPSCTSRCRRWVTCRLPELGPLSAHQGDGAPLGGLFPADAGTVGRSRNSGTAVEDDQGAGVELQPVEVAVELGKAGGKGVGTAGMPDFQLDGLSLDLLISVGFADEEVDPAAADAVLAVDEAVPVDGTGQEGHEHELHGDFAVGDAVEDLLVLGPELGER